MIFAKRCPVKIHGIDVSGFACETSRIWPQKQNSSRISYIRRTRGNTNIYKRKGKKKKKKRRKQRFSKSYSRREEPNAEGAKHWALSKRQVSMLEQLLFVCMDVSPKFPNRFWISSVRFRVGVSNFIRPLNSRPTWLQLVCKISPRANCRETISAATMCIEIRTASMPPNRRLASPASGISLIFRLYTTRIFLDRSNLCIIRDTIWGIPTVSLIRLIFVIKCDFKRILGI